MTGLRELKSQILIDDAIEDPEVRVIRDHVKGDGRIDLDDLKFLVELHCEAKRVCAAFHQLLFAAMKEHILEDGVVFLSEQFYLLKALYADGEIDDEERAFLRDLKRETREVTPEFEAMCERVLAE